MLRRKITVDITFTPEELAFVFSNMCDGQHAAFFNELARITRGWDKPFCFQLQALVAHPQLTREGRFIMEAIGDYGQDED